MKNFFQCLSKIYSVIIYGTLLILKFMMFVIIVIIVCFGIKKYLLVINENDYKIIPKINYIDYDIELITPPNEDDSIEGIYVAHSNPKMFKDEVAEQNLNFKELYTVSSITVGDTLIYELYYSGNIRKINLTPEHIGLCNCGGEISLVQSDENPRKIYLIISDIVAPYTNDTIYVTVNSGTAISSNFELLDGFKLPEIKIYQDDITRVALWLFPDGNAMLTLIVAIIGLVFSIKIPNKKFENKKTR